MGTVLSLIPGYGFLYSAQASQDGMQAAMRGICGAVGQKTAGRLVKKGMVVFCRHFDEFPAEVRRRCFSLVPRPACAWSAGHSKVFVDTSSAGRPDFAGCFVAEIGITAALSFERRMETETLLWQVMQEKVKNPVRSGAETMALIMAAIRRFVPPQDHRFHDIFYSMVHCLVETAAMSPGKCGYCPRSRRRAAILTRSNPPCAGLQPVDFYSFARLNAEAVAGGRPCEGGPVPSGGDGRPGMPLGATVTVSRQAVHPAHVLGGGTAARCAPGELSVYPAQAVGAGQPDSIISLNEADEGFVHDLPETNPLASLKLRPMAEMRIATLGLAEGDGCGDCAGFIRPFLTDFPCTEATPGPVLPFFESVCRKTVTIRSAAVDPGLCWAVFTAEISDAGTTPLPALCTSWGLQASFLRTETPYTAPVCLWARSVTRAEGTGDTAFRKINSGRYLPRVSMTALLEKVMPLGTAAGVKLSLLVCRTGSGGIFQVIAPGNAAGPETGPGQMVEATGIIVLGTLRKDDPEIKAVGRIIRANTNSHRLVRQLLRAGVKEGNSHAILAAAGHVSRRNRNAFRRRTSLLRTAAGAGHNEAVVLCCLHQLAARRNRARAVGRKPVRPDLASLQKMSFAACRGSKTALELLCFLPFASEGLPEVLRRSFLERLAFEFHDHRALWELSRAHQPSEADSPESILRFNLMAHSVLNGCDTGAFELARACALGLGTEENPDLARVALGLALNRGYFPAQYWFASYTFLGRDFFTMTSEEKRGRLTAEASSGAPHAILLLALFFACEDTGENSLLIACSLFSWLEATVQDQESASVRNELMKKLSDDEKKQLQLFDVWSVLGIPRPPVSVPLTSVMAQVADLSLQHLEFFRAIGPSGDSEEQGRSLQGQLSFFNENSEPVTFGWASKHNAPVPPHLGLHSFGLGQNGADPDDTHSLLIAGCLSKETGCWEPDSFYAFFPFGEEAEITLHSAIVSARFPSVGAINFSVARDSDSSPTYTALDFFWPSMMLTYRTGEHWRASLCGVSSFFEACRDVFEGMPPGVAETIRKNLARQSPGVETRTLVFSRLENSRTSYHINSEVIAAYPQWTEIAGVTYARIDVASPFSIGGAFPVYIPSRQSDGRRLPRAGENLSCVFELYVYAKDRSEARRPVTLN